MRPPFRWPRPLPTPHRCGQVPRVGGTPLLILHRSSRFRSPKSPRRHRIPGERRWLAERPQGGISSWTTSARPVLLQVPPWVAAPKAVLSSISSVPKRLVHLSVFLCVFWVRDLMDLCGLVFLMLAAQEFGLPLLPPPRVLYTQLKIIFRNFGDQMMRHL